MSFTFEKRLERSTPNHSLRLPDQHQQHDTDAQINGQQRDTDHALAMAIPKTMRFEKFKSPMYMWIFLIRDCIK